MTFTKTRVGGARLRRSAAGAGAAVAGVLLLAGCVAPGTADRDSDGHGQGAHQSDVSGDGNPADVMFAQMMIPHHEQAIEMSDLILAKAGVDAEVVELAEEIKAAQGPEIELMQSWLEEWDVPAMDDDDDDDDMAGMGMEGLLSDAEMDELKAADAATGASLFLEGMIEHHEGAIDMAEEHQENGESDEALDLSASIIESQTAEIERMRALLEG
ncbi:DUF305 domain-containing protein [Agromyces bauzanensis]